MTFAYWMLLVAALLPYLTVGLAKSGGIDNHAPRPSLEPPRIAYSEVMERVRNHPDLNPRWKMDVLSAVRRYVRRFEPVGMSAVVVPSEISATMAKATPVMAGLKPNSFSNMLSRLRVALRICDIIVQPGRHTIAMAPEWAAVFGPVADHRYRSRLSRFFYTATRHGWKPEEITTDHFRQFHQELSEKAVLKNAGRIAHEAARAWNSIADENPGLPHVDFRLPRKREPYTLAWDKYPDALGREIRELLGRLGNPDFLSEDHRPALRATTLRRMEFLLKQFAAALVHRGRSPSEIFGLETFCTAANFKEGLRFFHDLAGQSVKGQIFTIAETVYAIAKHHPDTDPAELKQMTAVIKALRRQKRSGLTPKNFQKLAQFDAPRNRDGLLLLPQKLHRTAVSHRQSGHFSKERAATVMMTAVAIEILLMCPLRVSNLAAMSLKSHIRRTHAGGVVTIHIHIPAEETKNKADIHCELPAPSVRMIEEYIEHFRPDLPGAANSVLLFPSRNGGRRTNGTFWLMISRTGRQYLGVDINPHLFRHLAAKLYLDEHPGGYEIVRRTLAHNSMDTTSKYYAGQETTRSIRHYDRTILKLRDEALAHPNNAGLRRPRS